MKIIYYNSAVARLCGRNGIIKAVLLNYIYNYHKPNIRKGAGHPACICLAECVDQYTDEDHALWGRSFIHKILKNMEAEGRLKINKDEDNRPVYTASQEVRNLLCAEDAVWVCFELRVACKCGICLAIVGRFILHIIDNSPKKLAYNLSVEKMSEVNCISPAQIYRAIRFLVEAGVVKRDKSLLKHPTRALALARC